MNDELKGWNRMEEKSEMTNYRIKTSEREISDESSSVIATPKSVLEPLHHCRFAFRIEAAGSRVCRIAMDGSHLVFRTENCAD